MLNIMNPPADWSTMKKLIWLRGTPITGGEELTVSGTPPLSLPNSLGKPMKAWSVDVLPKQDLNGYDNPWPAGGGKNKWNGRLETNPQTSVEVTYTQADDGTISGSGTANGLSYTSLMTFTISDAGDYIASSGLVGGSGSTYYLRVYKNGDALGNAFEGSDSLAINGLVAGDVIGFRCYVTNGTSANGVVWKPMLRLSSVTDSTYAPYSNICPIYGTDKLHLFVEESYDPSATPKAVVTLPSTVYTATIGSEGGESRDAKVTSDMFTYAPQNNNAGTGSVAYFLKSNYGFASSGTIHTNMLIFDSGSWSNIQANSIGKPDTYLVVCSDTPNQTLAQFREWFDNNAEVTLPLATPVQFPLTVPTIPTTRGTATTWSTAEDGTVESMEVTYVGKA